MKKAIFEEQTARALRKWQKTAKLRKKSRQTGGGDGGSSPGFMSVNSTPSRGTSPIHLLQIQTKSTGCRECHQFGIVLPVRYRTLGA